MSAGDHEALTGPVTAGAGAIRTAVEANRYLAAMAIQIVGHMLVLYAMFADRGEVGVLTVLLLLMPAGIYFRYLAHRGRPPVREGDYTVDLRLGWTAAAYAYGALVPVALRARKRAGRTRRQ